jgi:hypothetical protein
MVLQLYLDDSGTRSPDHDPVIRNDGMDHFALGGILVTRAGLPAIYDAHAAFLARWNINCPLHSARIRGKRDKFRWLGADEIRAGRFYKDLEDLLLSIDVLGIACVIDRPGYNARYHQRYGDRRWMMCKTAYTILVERAVKHARRQSEQLEVFFEGTGKIEDRAIVGYAKALKAEGMPFNEVTSGPYDALSATDFSQVILGEPQRLTKKSALMQLADLYLYPMAKAGYDQNYGPYVRLKASKKIIDDYLPAEERSRCGVKYSCFDTRRTN